MKDQKIEGKGDSLDIGVAIRGVRLYERRIERSQVMAHSAYGNTKNA